MKSRLKVYVPLLLINFVFVTALSGVAYADGEYDYLSDQLSREHRDGADVDEWIERGTATITASPRFVENGIRLTAWASDHDGTDSYEFAIASAVYFFEIPSQAQYVEILVRYRGEPSESYFEDAEPIAGRVWIRNLQREATRRYDDKSAEETRYGDTFVLRAKRRSETIKVAAAGHVDDDGLLEMHVVAEDGQQIDIEYINVSTYRKQHHIRVFPRYARHHHWRPWHRYTYSYFYDGPFYYGTDLGYYFRWTYPVYDRSYLSIRSAYGNYVHRYYTIHHRPYYYRSYPRHVHVYVNNRPARSTRLNRWSAEHETARREYTRSRLSTTVRANNRGNGRSRVNAVINQHRQEQSALAEQRQSSPGVRSRDRSNTNTRLNTTVHQRSRTGSTPRRSFTQPNRSNQSAFPRRRYQPYSRSNGSEYNRSARTNRTPTSNAERRQRLSERSRSSYSRQYRAPSSNSRYDDSSTRTRQQRSTNSRANRSRSSVSRQRTSTSSRTSSSTRSRPSPTVRQRGSSSSSRSSSSSSRSSSSSTSKDDDEEKNSRSRQTQRSRSRRR